MKFLLKISLCTNNLNRIIQLCAEVFFILFYLLESYLKICICHTFCHFYHMMLDETL